MTGLPDDLTNDALLGGRVRLRQPRQGYRAAIDPVLLAAAVPARAGDVVLDLGAGVGAAGLCLAARVAGCRVVGLERDAGLACLLAGNAAASGLDGAAVAGDAGAPPFAEGAFHHVLVNPPYLPAAAADPSPHARKAAADVEGALGLAGWIAAGSRLLRRGGTLTVIHRADRMPALLAALDAVGAVAVLPLWPRAGQPAKRVLAQARRGRRGPARLLPGLVLHGDGQDYTAAAEAVLRGGAALPWLAADPI